MNFVDLHGGYHKCKSKYGQCDDFSNIDTYTGEFRYASYSSPVSQFLTCIYGSEVKKLINQYKFDNNILEEGDIVVCINHEDTSFLEGDIEYFVNEVLYGGAHVTLMNNESYCGGCCSYSVNRFKLVEKYL